MKHNIKKFYELNLCLSDIFYVNVTTLKKVFS